MFSRIQSDGLTDALKRRFSGRILDLERLITDICLVVCSCCVVGTPIVDTFFCAWIQKHMMGAVIASVDLTDIVFRFREQFFVPVDNPYCGEQLVSVHTFIIHVYRSAVIVEAINRVYVAVNDVERVVDSRRHKGRSLVCVAYIHGIAASIAVILGNRGNLRCIIIRITILFPGIIFDGRNKLCRVIIFV